MDLPKTQIVAQLYNLRNYCTNESDFDETMAKLRTIGYEAVQMSGVPIAPAAARKIMDKNGIVCVAAHSNLAALLLDDVNAEIDRCKTLGCDFDALGGPGMDYLFNYEKCLELVDLFLARGEVFKANGIQLGYHNHHNEFYRYPENKKTMLETFYENTARPGNEVVFAEIDTHWVARGGQDPARWIYKVAGRMPVVHFKDFRITPDGPFFAEIGEGNLDWCSIIRACEDTGVRWYSIEQDAETPGRDIFESMKISYNNLKAMGVN